jgi:hypothetical protein
MITETNLLTLGREIFILYSDSNVDEVMYINYEISFEFKNVKWIMFWKQQE